MPVLLIEFRPLRTMFVLFSMKDAPAGKRLWLDPPRALTLPAG